MNVDRIELVDGAVVDGASHAIVGRCASDAPWTAVDVARHVEQETFRPGPGAALADQLGVPLTISPRDRDVDLGRDALREREHHAGNALACVLVQRARVRAGADQVTLRSSRHGQYAEFTPADRAAASALEAELADRHLTHTPSAAYLICVDQAGVTVSYQ